MQTPVAVLVALLLTLICVLSSRLVWDDYRFSETSPGIGISQWWYSIWLPGISIGIALRAVDLFVRRGQRAAGMIVMFLFLAFIPMMLVGMSIGAALGLAGATAIALANADSQ